MSQFSPGFVFGVATSADQIEGAVEAHGRGRSTWDLCSHTTGKTTHGEWKDGARCDQQVIARHALPAGE